MSLSSITAYLPPAEGLLPKWILFLAVVSIGNSFQAYASLGPTRKVYAGPRSAVNPLSARTFGTWTFISAVVRLYAAYNINDRAWYNVAMWVFGAAWGHFVSEWLVFRTAAWGKGLAGPVIISSISLVWMFLQKGFYVS
ncbi:ergosterol 28 [Myriangium duriaei CBS 260.36]|uniref:Ergosterol 28 n=1 Tax=Myriangium duriaei CBS 260.36 TaxID=1168546 RepID=A0A9P4J013_9PEZI|nr:ergosterol 28 [Myriangium duriaei CBS 260.36]